MAKLKTIDADLICRKANRYLAEGAARYMGIVGQKRVKKIMSEAIEEKVYDRYTPKKYERRGELKNINNMKRDVKMNRKIQAGQNGAYIEGHLYITNRAKTRSLTGAKIKKEDFLYGIKDGSSQEDGYVANLMNSPSYDEWGNGGKPLHINAEVDKKVNKSQEIRKELKQSALVHARKRFKKEQN